MDSYFLSFLVFFIPDPHLAHLNVLIVITTLILSPSDHYSTQIHETYLSQKKTPEDALPYANYLSAFLFYSHSFILQWPASSQTHRIAFLFVIIHTEPRHLLPEHFSFQPVLFSYHITIVFPFHGIHNSSQSLCRFPDKGCFLLQIL